MADQKINFLVGNTNTGGVVTYVGDIGYTAVVDIVKGVTVEQSVPLTLGVSTPITIVNWNVTAHRAVIKIVPISDSWKFTSAANLRGTAIDFSSGTINYTINGSSMVNVNTALQYTTVIVTAENEAPPVVDNDPNKSYSLSISDMEEFQSQLFAKANSENIDTGTGSANLNILDFVVGAKRFPFTIDPDYIASNVAIAVRDATFNTADLLTTAKVNVDMGHITIPAVNNSSLDFVGVQCNLVTPFDSSFIDLPVEVIGKTLGIMAVVDLINGSATINIKDGDVLILSQDITVGDEYPIFGNYQVKDIGITPLSSNNTVTKTFIRVRSPLLDGNLIMSRKRGVLAGVTGYIEVENISLNIQALNEEKIELLNILKSGVYVK